MRKEMQQKIELLEQKMSKSPNSNGNRFLYRREKMIRFKLLLQNISQKTLAQYLKVTESYVSKLITGERYNHTPLQFICKHFVQQLKISYGDRSLSFELHSQQAPLSRF